jgi:flagellar biosynthesis chaperone FliJ
MKERDESSLEKQLDLIEEKIKEQSRTLASFDHLRKYIAAQELGLKTMDTQSAQNFFEVLQRYEDDCQEKLSDLEVEYEELHVQWFEKYISALTDNNPD